MGPQQLQIQIPPHSLGVADSWNKFARELGRCVIANDDVSFGLAAIAALEGATGRHA